MRMAELDALAELSPEERELYIRLNEKYNCLLDRETLSHYGRGEPRQERLRLNKKEKI